MGQYFIFVNLDKKEVYKPLGRKLWEICANNDAKILAFLLRKSSERGGGDIEKDYKYAGRWAGDRILVIGDYDESKLYDIAEKEYTDITKEATEEFNDFMGTDDLKIISSLEELLEYTNKYKKEIEERKKELSQKLKEIAEEKDEEKREALIKGFVDGLF
jgi:hypothetical protein